MTPADLIAELFNKYPGLGILLYILAVLLIIAAVIFIIIFVISFFTGKPFPILSKNFGGDEGARGSPDPSSFKTSLSVKKLPKTQKDLEKILNKVNEAAFSREKEEARKQYDILITLLSDAHLYNNLVLHKLVETKVEPYEVWLKAEKLNSEIYRNTVEEIEFSLYAISEITAHTEKHSIRRASITLISQDSFLRMVSSNVHPLGRRPDKIFKVADTPECGIAGYVAYTRKARRVGDVLKDRYYKKFPTTPEYASLLTVPIMIEDRVLGTFSIDSTVKNAFTDIDEKRVYLFSHSITAAIITLMLDDLIGSMKLSL